MQIVTAYFGINNPPQSIADIKIDENIYYQPYGLALYLNADKQAAVYEGKYIFEVRFNAENMYTRELHFDIETNGTFGQFMDLIAKHPDEFMPKEILNDDSLSDDGFRYAVNNYLDENEEKYFQQYQSEQAAIKRNLETDYDGVFDGSEYAVYFPEKVILDLKMTEVRSW